MYILSINDLKPNVRSCQLKKRSRPSPAKSICCVTTAVTLENSNKKHHFRKGPYSPIPLKSLQQTIDELERATVKSKSNKLQEHNQQFQIFCELTTTPHCLHHQTFLKHTPINTIRLFKNYTYKQNQTAKMMYEIRTVSHE